MLVSFHIDYWTKWGEKLGIVSCCTGTKEEASDQLTNMTTTDGIRWSLEMDISVSTSTENQLSYYYCVCDEQNQILRKEWQGTTRRIYLPKRESASVRMVDSWKDLPAQHPFFSTAFTQSLLAQNSNDKRLGRPKEIRRSVQLRLDAPTVSDNYDIYITGNQKNLGNWEPANGQQLVRLEAPEYVASLNANEWQYPVEYKFILRNKISKEFGPWEANNNHELSDPKLGKEETAIYHLGTINFEIPLWKGAGVAIPVFSLQSSNSCGVGDFGDLASMVDWTAKTHQKVLQILPVNDTTMTHTWTDSYPYNSISIYAFHPMYVDINQLPAIKNTAMMTEFETERQQLNALKEVDYEAVNTLKWKYYKLSFAQDGRRIMGTTKFKEWFLENEEWLKPYAVFSSLRDKYQTADFTKWPKYRVYNPVDIDHLCDDKKHGFNVEISSYYYIQFHLHTQLLKAKDYAHKKGVILKGDIPIGISRNSVEAWSEPYYFNLDGQAGAPPDDFSVLGQNWGFPTYNWDRMAQDNYAWWRKRFQKMATYFDAYRIDHILGFFRIWQIPMHSVHGLLGQFVPSLPMTREEIESYGLSFEEHFFLTPYIHENFLYQIFGSHIDRVRTEFLDTTATFEVYQMKPEFDTQRKVKDYFEGKTDEDSVWIREGLYSLISNVLFIRDVHDANRFHPRIAVQNDFIYHSLSDEKKAAFNRLYNHYYYHRHNDFWYKQAMNKLPILTESTNMLVCGEDLGMIPDCVPAVMDTLQILSLEIQRMPKNPKLEFGRLLEYPYRSVCTFSTHDMSTLRMWWQEDAESTQKYYNSQMGHWGDAPKEASPEICYDVVRNQLFSQSMLCIMSFQDWLSINGHWRLSDASKERINVPANPKHYWRYRMHLTIEELLMADELNTAIAHVIDESGRN
ncbi:MAG: 4-alpha-glucanotransferase [Bacteroidaceae bacterium]